MTVGSLKEKIKSTFPGEWAVSVLHALESVLVPALVPDEKAVRKFYKKKTGRELDLDHPVLFSEKMNWYKLHHRDPLMQTCADKVAVRDYVRSLGYGDLLNEVYGVYDKVSEIDLDALPEQVVLKAAHGSHMGYIITDKANFNWKRAKAMMRTWLWQNIYWSGREWVYRDIPKRILAEKYLEDPSGDLKDYKFICFHGEPTYLEYDGERFSDRHYCNYYDMDGNLLDLDDDVGHNPEVAFPLSPEDLEKMKQIARDLAKPFQEVRVDLYLVGGKIYFGELTFFHNGGITWFCPEEYDRIFGQHWTVEP